MNLVRDSVKTVGRYDCNRDCSRVVKKQVLKMKSLLKNSFIVD